MPGPQANAIGLNVIEREVQSTPIVAGPEIGKTGLVFTSEKGPVWKPIRLTNLDDARRVFGGFSHDFSVYNNLKGLYTNAGAAGAVVYGVRVEASAQPGAAATAVLGAGSQGNTTSNVWLISGGYLGAPNPGEWANGTVSVDVGISSTDPKKRDVSVFSGEGPAQQRVEYFPNVDSKTAPGIINNAELGSRFIMLRVLDRTKIPDPTKAPVKLGSGEKGTDYKGVPTVADYERGLAALNGIAVQVVANLDLDSPEWATALDGYCSTRGDVVGVGHVPPGVTTEYLKTAFSSIIKAKSYIALFKGHLLVIDGFGGTKKISPTGHVIGAGFVRKPHLAGGIPHVSPAGGSAFLLDVQDVEDSLYGPRELKDLVNGTNINPIVFESGRGFFAKTSRTMSSLAKHVSIHVRILTNYIKSALQGSLSMFEQEGNTEDTRRKLRESILSFMTKLDGQGAFEKTGGFNNNVSVVCDAGNNPISVINQRRLVCDVTFRPVEVAEEVQVNLVQTREGTLVSEQ